MKLLRTFLWGALPIAAFATLVVADHVPGTDIPLTVPYAAEGPGPSFNTLGDVDGVEVVDIEGADVDDVHGNLNMTTVSVRHGMSLSQALVRWLTTDDTLIPIEQIFPPDLSEEQVRDQNSQAFSASGSTATLAAMQYLQRPVEVTVAEVQEDSAASKSISSGDVITSIDGIPADKPALVRAFVQNHKPGDTVQVGLRKDSAAQEGEQGEETTVEVKLGKHPDDESVPLLGVTMMTQPAGGVRVHYNLEEVGGPSAGLMFTLAVIDKLSPGDLGGGKFVAGTGTISEDGKVGPIGGIEHKVRSARDLGAEVFLAPEANCAEAVRRGTGDMVVLKITDLDQAIQQLKNYSDGSEVETCS
ncbi:PDZ domain-containing protein [Corynebacterium sp.]|uniref:YlbL family protein n=1 Tax=Corynebacterium sp. TaxID=1720 RepID=UPI0026DB505A|nr:PDZ domain-containing protein [Corynebacterium sp.]MDO5077284.1 PDZ domain-containing protein [Corynebacterium sp.]